MQRFLSASDRLASIDWWPTFYLSSSYAKHTWSSSRLRVRPGILLVGLRPPGSGHPKGHEQISNVCSMPQKLFCPGAEASIYQ